MLCCAATASILLQARLASVLPPEDDFFADEEGFLCSDVIAARGSNPLSARVMVVASSTLVADENFCCSAAAATIASASTPMYARRMAKSIFLVALWNKADPALCALCNDDAPLLLALLAQVLEDHCDDVVVVDIEPVSSSEIAWRSAGEDALCRMHATVEGALPSPAGRRKAPTRPQSSLMATPAAR
jgi:hypothetical protein